MKLSEKHLNEFIALYTERYGEVLSYDVAHEKATKLLRLVELVESNQVKHD